MSGRSTIDVFDLREVARQRVREICDKGSHSGFSQKKLAEMAGIPASNLSAFMKREAGLSIRRFEQLCVFLGLRLVVDNELPIEKQEEEILW